MALCTQADVETRLQIEFENDQEPVVADLIDAAQAHIERVAGRQFEADDHTETFDGPETVNIWLTHTPINSVASVTVDGSALSASGYTLNPATGRLTRTVSGRPRSWRSQKYQSIEVAYNGGYETIPEDLVDICARAVARAFQAGQAAASSPSAGVKQISLAGSDSVTFATETTNVTAAVFLTPEETAVARHYRNDIL